ncbi:MAG TPA: hypothetical protein VFF52_22205, partial [Isosphaeraceae bacterium]|nr:hypothetical protein [Isosphaeraceae bacterium]
MLIRFSKMSGLRSLLRAASPMSRTSQRSHHGWTWKVDSTARLVWPVSSFNPYSNGLETDLRYADDAGLALALQPLEISRLAIEIPPPV